MAEPTEYNLDAAAAEELADLVAMPSGERRDRLTKLAEQYSQRFMIDVFAEFIGLANSVVANNREMVELLLITEGNMHPHRAEKANLPTIAGALRGVRVAEGIDQRRTCPGCAFRLGSPANQSPVTTADAEDAGPMGLSFMCHEGLSDDDEPRRSCGGFVQRTRPEGIGRG